MSDATSDLIFWHCRDLINHKSGRRTEAVAFVWCNRNAKQWRLSWIRGYNADCNRFSGIETIILQNDRRSRLAGIILRPGDRPYFSTLQSITRLQ